MEINLYGDRFFQADHIVYVSEENKVFIKKHISHRLTSLDLVNSRLLVGYGSIVETEEVAKFADVSVKSVVVAVDRNALFDAVGREYKLMSEEKQIIFVERLREWVEHYKQRSTAHYPGRIRSLIDNLSILADDLPF